MGGQGCSSTDNDSDGSAENGLEFLEENHVEERRGLLLWHSLGDLAPLSLHSRVEQKVGDERALHLGVDLGVDPVKDSWHAGKDGGLEHGDILQQEKGAAPPVSDSATVAQEGLLHDPVENVSQGKVAHEPVGLSNGDLQGIEKLVDGLELGDHVLVLDHHALWISGRTAGVHDGAEVLWLWALVRFLLLGTLLEELVVGENVDAEVVQSRDAFVADIAPVDERGDRRNLSLGLEHDLDLLRGNESDLALGVVHDVFHRVLSQGIVKRDADSARLVACLHADHPLLAVSAENSDLGAHLDALGD